jgi:peptidyl-tRNA hydrolase
LSKIANQLAAKAAKAVSQADLDTQWQKFLTDGSPKLAAQVDDKTLLLALRG